MTALHAPWRIGTTSYVVDDDLVGNARYLAGRVQDMQLVLFDLPGGPGNLPSPAALRELVAIGTQHGLGYTVHLMHDLAALEGGDDWTHALAWAHLVIARTRVLRPWAYVLHLDGRRVRDGVAPREHWLTGVSAALRKLALWAGNPARLAVENLEGYAPDFVQDAVVQSGVGRCVDVGHLWLDGVAPCPWLAQAGQQLRVVHLHGVRSAAGRREDHVALDAVAGVDVDAVVRHLALSGFAGVLTLEVFGQADFEASLRSLSASMARCGVIGMRDGAWANS